MLNLAICDDEQYFREWIKEMLLQYMRDKGTYYEIDTLQSGTELLDLAIELNQHQTIFLDINMDKVDGLNDGKKNQRTEYKSFYCRR